MSFAAISPFAELWGRECLRWLGYRNMTVLSRSRSVLETAFDPRMRRPQKSSSSDLVFSNLHSVENRRQDGLRSLQRCSGSSAQGAEIVRTWGAACCAPTNWSVLRNPSCALSYLNSVGYGAAWVSRTGTGGTCSGAYSRTFSSGPLCHWCDRRWAAFLTCPKGYVSQWAADRMTEY